jgi:hypothetical protein
MVIFRPSSVIKRGNITTASKYVLIISLFNTYLNQIVYISTVYDTGWPEDDHEILQIVVSLICRGKDKAIPLQAFTGPEGSRRLKFPDF